LLAISLIFKNPAQMGENAPNLVTLLLEKVGGFECSY
jgi:hypothetical protein